MKIENLPFYWRIKTLEDGNTEIPSNMNFEFEFDERFNLIVQKPSSELNSVLNKVYMQDYNIGCIQEVNTLAKGYGDDLFGQITSILKLRPSIKKVLEIGCGGCSVLRRVHALGLKVKGVDPSPIAKRESLKYGFDVDEGFFDSKRYEGESFDLIYHSDVLEHLENPLEFLKSQYDLLSDNGAVLVAVPDNTLSIEIGDISMAMHQHLSYFDSHSLQRMMHAAGFKDIQTEVATYGGNLYGIGFKNKGLGFQNTKLNSFKDFKNKAMANIEKFQNVISTKNDLGLYVPLRAFPYIYASSTTHKFRIFDDTPHWHAGKFDGYESRIENFGDLEINPASDILCMSLTFGNVIKEKIKRSSSLSKTNVITLNELISNTL